MSNFQPIIKWTGSKRSQSDEIIEYFPKEIDTYYEPFCGGCSMMRRLLDSDIHVKNIICSDINNDLISTWKEIKNNPSSVFENYSNMWKILNSTNDIDKKRDYFEQQRKIFNETHNPYIFFFIMRTCTNGMPRYNKNGDFNNSFHITRNGIDPKNLKPILSEWSNQLNKYNVNFINCSYEHIFDMCNENDFIYLDPPYYNTKGIYYNHFDYNKFFTKLIEINKNNIKYLLSFDGISGNEDNTCSDVPKECYNKHVYIKSGNSSFKRVTGNDKNAMVYESLYMNFHNEYNGLF